MADLPFVTDMPLATRETWLKLVDGVLKGGDFEKKLVSATADGIRIEPLYPKASGRVPVAGRALGAPWAIVQRVDHPDAREANALALTDLENGATGLSLVFAGAPAAHGFGLPPTTEAVEAALDGVFLDAGVEIAVDAGSKTRDVARILTDHVKARGIAPSDVRIRFGFDPLGGLAAEGRLRNDWAEVAPNFAEAVRERVDLGFTAPIVAADARVVHAAGGSEAQELAYALSSAVAYLRALEASGLSLDKARATLEFRLAADADQFLTIAKFRAIRKLWARVEQACGLEPKPVFVAAETAWRMMTRRDPWVNLLRQTVAVFAAGVAGANAVTVLPFTQAIGLPDAFARRIARNTQLVLLEESNLAKVADPSAGSGGLETLTDELCSAAWSLFQAIESEGGLSSALVSGFVQKKVAETRAARDKAVARRKEAVTGTSEFPDVKEAPVAVLKPAPAPQAPAGGKVEPLRPARVSEPFEALRDAADAASVRPQVFLAALGPIAAFTARAMFAKNLFEAGGIAAAANDGFAKDGSTDLAAMAAAFKASGAGIACLCSTDEIYAAEGEKAATALLAAGAKRVYMAGRPGDLEPALKQAGVGGFVFVGCDVLATLREAHAILGIQAEAR
jgi:methylmalonyl-CoA mutase